MHHGVGAAAGDMERRVEWFIAHRGRRAAVSEPHCERFFGNGRFRMPARGVRQCPFSGIEQLARAGVRQTH
jgi:hypothetical protein